MSALVSRTAALHAAFWHYDRWYRWAWFVWPQALAVLLAGWLVGEGVPLWTGKWAKPADCSNPSNPGCAATQRVVFAFPGGLLNPTLAVHSTVPVDESAFRSSSAADQPRLRAALAAYYRSESQKALDALKPAAANDPNVQLMHALALLIPNTMDGVRNAQNLLRTAGVAGQRQAGAVLGRTLMLGLAGLPKDVPQGRKLIEEGVAAGEPYALRLAAAAYLGREFGSYDPAKAADLMRKSADAGDPFAMISYAAFLQSSIGVVRDEVKSIDYLRRAAEAGSTGAQYLLGQWIATRYNNREIEDPSESMKWYQRAYEQGYNFFALVNLAYDLKSGRTAPWFDTARSFSLLQLCAPYAFANCHAVLGDSYRQGSGTPQDLVRAYAHYTLARQLGRQDVASILQQLDSIVTPAQKNAAIELANKLSPTLKLPPPQILLQIPEAIAGPSPWGTAAPKQPQQVQTQQTQTAAPASAQTPGAPAPTQPSSAASADWSTCKGKDPDLAIAACTRLIASGLTGKDLGLAHWNRGARFHQKKQYEQAISEYSEAIQHGADAQNDRGVTFQALGNLDAALRDYDAAVHVKPSDSIAHANRAYIYLRKNQLDKAIADATVAIRLDPKYARAYWIRAGGYELTGRWTDVVADCTTALGIAPKFDACLDRRGYAYSRMGKSDLALADYDESLRLAPRSPWTLTARGNVRRSKQLMDLAIGDYTEAIKQNPKYASAWANRAETRFLNKQYELAIADATKAIELDRNSSLAFAVRGRAEGELGKLNDASMDLATAVELAPKDSRLRYFSAVAEVRIEEKLYESCPKQGTRRNSATDRIGGGGPPVCFTGPQYLTALRELSEAIRLDPEYDSAYAYRGKIYLVLQQRERGIADLRKALQINPGNEYARNTLRSINVSP